MYISKLWPLFLSVSVVADAISSSSATAVDLSGFDKVREYAEESSTKNVQTISVRKLIDVKSNDWTFQTLQSLANRYGCNQERVTYNYQSSELYDRQEFAADLQDCINEINKDVKSVQDLDTLKHLMEEFKLELATLQDRNHSLRVKSTLIEHNQFSGTTKLSGRADFVFYTVSNDAGGVNAPQAGTTQLAYRADLNFNTSFTGRDLLKTLIRIRNGVQTNNLLNTGDRSANIEQFGISDVGQGQNNGIYLDRLYYQFPVNDISILVGAAGIQPSDYGLRNATFFPGNSAVPSFIYAAPNIYAFTRNGQTSAIGVNLKISNNFSWQFGYINRNSSVLIINNNTNNSSGGNSGGFLGLALLPRKSG